MNWQSALETLLAVLGGGAITIFATFYVFYLKDIRESHLRIVNIYIPLIVAHGDLEREMLKVLEPIYYRDELADPLRRAQNEVLRCLLACRPIRLVDPDPIRNELLSKYINHLELMRDVYEKIKVGIMDHDDNPNGELHRNFESASKLIQFVDEKLRQECVVSNVRDLVKKS